MTDQTNRNVKKAAFHAVSDTGGPFRMAHTPQPPHMPQPPHTAPWAARVAQLSQSAVPGASCAPRAALCAFAFILCLAGGRLRAEEIASAARLETAPSISATGKNASGQNAVAGPENTAGLETVEARPASFNEIWGYLMNGEENLLDPANPVTDIGYFGASINYRGKLYGVPDRKRLSKYAGRVHLVVAEVSNQALTHFCLDPAYTVRDELLAAIVTAAAPYDGVQIDFELVPASDAEYLISFLSQLKKRLGGKTLSVAIPARTRNVGDAYDYRAISRVCDRVVVMAYDEHWSGSTPGAIASLAWCRKVSVYALSLIDAQKLVMGIPFYGRAWADTNPSKAYRFSNLEKLIAEQGITSIERNEGIPTFEYSQITQVRVFFEDANSILARARMYEESSVLNISFWRLGQEDPAVWTCLSVAD